MDGYRLISTIYDAALEPFNAPLRTVARRTCPVQAGAVVLDVGCGTGAALAEYARDGARTIGVDPSQAMLDRARQRLGPEADLRRITGERLPVADRCADLVLISLVLHGLPRAEAIGVLHEAARCLAPGGRILITDFGASGLRFPRGHATRALTAVAEILAGPGHARNSLGYLRSGGLTTLLGEAGLVASTQRRTAGGNVTIVVAVPGTPSTGTAPTLSA